MSSKIYTKWMSTHSCESNTWEDRSASSSTSAVNLPMERSVPVLITQGTHWSPWSWNSYWTREEIGSRSLWSQSSTSNSMLTSTTILHNCQWCQGYIASCMVSHRVPSCTSELMSRSEGKNRDLWIYLHTVGVDIAEEIFVGDFFTQWARYVWTMMMIITQIFFPVPKIQSELSWKNYSQMFTSLQLTTTACSGDVKVLCNVLQFQTACQV
jgi:hypothetical protein